MEDSDIKMAAIILLVTLIVFVVVTIGMYIIQSSAVGKMNEAIKGKNSIISWIPLANIWLYGTLSDEVESRKVKWVGKLCLISSILYMLEIIAGLWELTFVTYVVYNLALGYATYGLAKKCYYGTASILLGLVSIFNIPRLIVMYLLGNDYRSYSLSRKGIVEQNNKKLQI